MVKRACESDDVGSIPTSGTMKEDERLKIEAEVVDTIIERPISFTIDGEQFSLYPPSLGVTYLVAPITQRLGFDAENIKINVFAELLRVCQNHTREVCNILALYSFRKRYDLFDTKLIESRISTFMRLSNADLASLYMTTLDWSNIKRYTDYFGLDKERKTRQRVADLQNKTSKTLSFGGRSVYGSLIDYACERYGWTMQYVVWGISYANLQMLVADANNTAYLSDEEMKKLGIQPGNSELINGDDPKNAELIRKFFND